MSDNYTEVVVLCEDRQQWGFIYRVLTRNGVNRHRIRLRTQPSGKGSGKQFVQDEYAREVVEHRKRASRMNIGLIVMHDCDTETVEGSRNRLEESATRSPGDRIALFFPRRNIETWIHFFNGEEVDESTVYRKFEHESDCHKAADHLAAKDEYTISPNVPSSLIAACPEIRRIFPQKRCVGAVG